MAGISKGAVGEVLAARYLRQKGYTILSANYRTRFGEIDIIAADKKYIAFVEVKQRGSAAIYTPKEAVTSEKQRKLRRTAMLYLQTHREIELQPRFDVISIVMAESDDPMQMQELTHDIAAFDAEDMYATV